MKRFNWVILLVMVVLWSSVITGCSKVEAGHVGVKVNLLGGDKGVDTEELGPGRYFIGLNEELYLFPTFTQNYVWTKSSTEGSENDESITFQTTKGMIITADIGIAYCIDPTKVSEVFQKYRKGVDELTGIVIRNIVRDAINAKASVLEVDEIYGEGKVPFMQSIRVSVTEQLAPLGIIIEKISLIGALRLPDIVVEGLDKKLLATQKAEQRENEVAEAKAAADKVKETAKGAAEAVTTKATAEAQAILTIATAQAAANKKVNATLTNNLIRNKYIDKWNGVEPQVASGKTLNVFTAKK